MQDYSIKTGNSYALLLVWICFIAMFLLKFAENAFVCPSREDCYQNYRENY